ncbi:MAG: hypothetical protein JSV03_05220, partial [Planctomycetota bacterium]
MIRDIVKAGLILTVVVMVLVSTGCRKPGTTKSTVPAYDPNKDPLVNPPSLFEPPPKDKSEIAIDETLFLQLDGSPNTLNPLFASSWYEFLVIDCLYDSFLTFDNKFIIRPNENIVESLEESDDHTTFTVKLKPDLRWHDGHPFTAHDVVYSWQQILDPQVPCLTHKASTEPIKECIALDDHIIKLVQPDALATARLNLEFPIIPRHIFAKEKTKHPDLKTGEYYNQQNRYPVGNGPYRIVEWKGNDKVVIERWEEYTGR